MALLLAQTGCFGQIDRTGLSGTVRDNGGGRLPGAHITAIQAGTGLMREALSSSSGAYDIPELPIGIYRITCSAPGFQMVVYASVEQFVGQTRTLDIALAVGSVTQQVNVSGQGSMFEETTAALGARTEVQQVKDLPLNGRNWSTLCTATLTPAAPLTSAWAIKHHTKSSGNSYTLTNPLHFVVEFAVGETEANRINF